jgi:hypothetical protein
MKSVTTKRFRPTHSIAKRHSAASASSLSHRRDDPSYPALQFKQDKPDVPPLYPMRIMNKIHPRLAGVALGDALALLLFLIIGEIQHNMLGSPDLIPNLLKQLVAFGTAWFVAAWAIHAFPTQPFNAKSFLGRSALAWLFAAPAGIVLRAILLGQAVIVMPFVFAALGFGGLILLAWRAIYAIARMMIEKRQRPMPTAATQA